MKPNFRNLFIKKLTLDRVVPIISASVSWKYARQTFLAGIEELINEIRFNSDVAQQQMTHKQFGEDSSLWSTRIIAGFESRTIKHSLMAVAVARRSG